MGFVCLSVGGEGFGYGCALAQQWPEWWHGSCSWEGKINNSAFEVVLLPHLSKRGFKLDREKKIAWQYSLFSALDSSHCYQESHFMCFINISNRGPLDEDIKMPSFHSRMSLVTGNFEMFQTGFCHLYNFSCFSEFLNPSWFLLHFCLPSRIS